uniref:Uncharacterized protein n=1 Tax=Ciona savignyi TaxID=51511 RepID=H2ZNL2_CIOSA
MEVLGPDLKKSLNFDVTTMDNCTDQDADVPCQAPTSVKVTETRSISTETETNEFVVEKALMAISQQISLIQDSFREKETNENASQTVPEIENPNTQDQNASFSNQDLYQDLYMKQLCKTKLLEAKLKQYTCLDATFPNYILKWRSTLEQMQRKVQQIASTSSRLRAWKNELTMIKQCENKELMDLKETCRQNIDEINLLKLNQVDFNELQLKYAKLEEN